MTSGNLNIVPAMDLGCKQRFRNAVNDRIGLEPDPVGSHRSHPACRLIRTYLGCISLLPIMAGKVYLGSIDPLFLFG